MTAQREFDRLMSAWLEADAPARAPTGLADAAIAGVVRTARRPAWRIPERWISMQLSTPLRPVPRLTPILVVLVLILASLAAAIWFGSRAKVPPLFGPARPGALVYEGADHVITIGGVDGAVIRRLSDGDSKDNNPAWSRDGTKIAFFSAPSRGTTAQLVVESADGSGRTALVTDIAVQDGLAHAVGPYWAPDGSAVAYLRIHDESRTEDVDVVALDGSPPRVLVPGAPFGANPAWGADSNTLAYCGSPDGVRRAVYVVAADGKSQPRQLSEALDGDLVCPDIAWSPDGRRMAYRRGSGDGPTGGVRVWTIDADGRNERRLTTSTTVEMNPMWSPGGDRIAFGRRVGQDANQIPTFQLVIVDPDGGSEITIAGLPPLLYGSWIWSPDGSQLLVQTTNAENFLVDPLGKKQPVSVPSWGDWQRAAY